MTARTSLMVGPSVTLTPCDAVAAIILVDGRYLLQLRDPKPDIFFPDHWGFFGGGIEPGENETDALLRELDEELRLVIAVENVRRFTCLTFDFEFSGGPQKMVRAFYELHLVASQVDALTIREGKEMRVFGASDVLDSGMEVAPYDSFVLWMHANKERIVFPV